MPEITVIITTYNLHEYINGCLEELFGQTYQNFDIVIVDDCSTDCTCDIIRQWQKKYPNRIKTIFLKENLGLPALTRNVALDSDLVDGNCILFLDGDDSIEPNLLEKLYHALSFNNASVSICAYDRVEYETGHVLCQEMRGFPEVLEMPPDNDILAFINTAPWNKLWKKDVFADGRFPAYKVGEEVALFYSIYTKCERIAFVDDVLIHYKVHKGSVISYTPQESIVQFAEELKTCFQKQTGIYRNCMGLIAFLHIGLSMAFRAADNCEIDMKEHIKWTREYFSNDFLWFQNNPYLRLRSLKNHGIKGITLKIALLAYQFNVFYPVVVIYKFVTKKLHIDIKF